jgi:hypothetical protein
MCPVMVFREDLSSVLLEAFILKIKEDACFPFTVFVRLSVCGTSRTAERIFIKFDGGNFH